MYRTIPFFVSPGALRVGRLVAGPSLLVELPTLFSQRPGMGEQEMRDECKNRGIPLYEVAKIIKWRFWRFSRHIAVVRRLSDGKKFRISLKEPDFDFLAVRTEDDMRVHWAQLNFLTLHSNAQ